MIEQFCRWKQDALDKGIKELSKLVEMFKLYANGAMQALFYFLSDVMAERLNAKIQKIKLTDRGYRTFKNFGP